MYTLPLSELSTTDLTGNGLGNENQLLAGEQEHQYFLTNPIRAESDCQPVRCPCVRRTERDAVVAKDTS